MGLRVNFKKEPEHVVPKTEDLEIETVSFPPIIHDALSYNFGIQRGSIVVIFIRVAWPD